MDTYFRTYHWVYSLTCLWQARELDKNPEQCFFPKSERVRDPWISLCWETDVRDFCSNLCCLKSQHWTQIKVPALSKENQYSFKCSSWQPICILALLSFPSPRNCLLSKIICSRNVWLQHATKMNRKSFVCVPYRVPLCCSCATSFLASCAIPLKKRQLVWIFLGSTTVDRLQNIKQPSTILSVLQLQCNGLSTRG